MNEKQLKKIEARCNAATWGEWRREPRWGRVWAEIPRHSPIFGKHFETKLIADTQGNGDDAVFIAAARQDIPLLIAALREAWTELAQIKEDARHDGIERDLRT